jgi:glycosyltransferase involved in cell wall biosynthesis
MFDFVTRARVLDFESFVRGQGCEVYHLSCSSMEDEGLFRREMDNILDNRYDVVHLHTSYWNGYIAEELAMAHGCPTVIVHAHSTNVLAGGPEGEARRRRHERIKNAFSENWRQYATHLCACSRLAADWLFGAPIPKTSVQILKNAIETERFAYHPDIRKKYREDLGLGDCFVLGHVGRFTYEKNHRFLLDVFRGVAAQCPTARFLLVGDGETQEEVRGLAQTYGVCERVLFLGRRKDVDKLMQAMDVFLLPSFYEGFSMVLAEAQAAGLPCLASPFVPDEVRLTPLLSLLPLDVGVWGDCILKLAEGYDRTDGSALLDAAGYSISKNIRLVEALYSSHL